MNTRTLRRLWPQKVRTRLTLTYAALFLAAGHGAARADLRAARRSLPTQPPSSLTISSQVLQQHAPGLQADGRRVQGPRPAEPDRVQAGDGRLLRRHRRGLPSAAPASAEQPAKVRARRPRRHNGRLRRPGLVHVRPDAAPGAGDYRDRPPGVRAAPRRAAGADRGQGRAQGAGRHVRRHARTPGRGVRHPAPVRRQRLARAAHAADRDAHGDRRDPGRAVPDSRANSPT